MTDNENLEFDFSKKSKRSKAIELTYKHHKLRKKSVNKMIDFPINNDFSGIGFPVKGNKILLMRIIEKAEEGDND